MPSVLLSGKCKQFLLLRKPHTQGYIHTLRRMICMGALVLIHIISIIWSKLFELQVFVSMDKWRGIFPLSYNCSLTPYQIVIGTKWHNKGKIPLSGLSTQTLSIYAISLLKLWSEVLTNLSCFPLYYKMSRINLLCQIHPVVDFPPNLCAHQEIPLAKIFSDKGKLSVMWWWWFSH